MASSLVSNGFQRIAPLVVLLCVFGVYMPAVQFADMALAIHKSQMDAGISRGLIETLLTTYRVLPEGGDRSMHDIPLMLVFFGIAAWRRWRRWRVWIGATVVIPLVDFLLFQLPHFILVPELLFALPQSAAMWFMTAIPAGVLAAAVWNLYSFLLPHRGKAHPTRGTVEA